MTLPRLTFFCELATAPLVALFSAAQVSDDLTALQASVSLGILDLSPERAGVVRRLNEAGIPLIAWQLLPKDQGYWFNLGNAAHAVSRYAQFKDWTATHGLIWAGVGLDIEPDIREIEHLLDHRRQILPFLVRRLFRQSELREAQLTYQALVTQIRADGYAVDSYLIPPTLDERRAGSTLLQRLAGLVDLRVEREVLMLYTSFMRPYGPGVLWSYAPEAQSIGVGNTGGGVDVGQIGQVPPLTWPELVRDVRLARLWTDDIHIFCLEGCVEHGLLAKLRTFDWDEPFSMTLPPQAGRIELIRQTLRAGLWASAHPFLVVTALVAIIGLGQVFRKVYSPSADV